MISKLGIFIKASIILLGSNVGFAQESITDGNPLGTAHEFSGVSKFITFPSKFLFGSPELLESRIVDGYRGNLYEIVECFRQDDLLLLGKVESEWWSKPAYIHIPQEVVEDWKAQLIEEAGSDQPSSPAEIPQEVVEALEEAGSDQPSSPDSERASLALSPPLPRRRRMLLRVRLFARSTLAGGAIPSLVPLCAPSHWRAVAPTLPREGNAQRGFGWRSP